MLFKEQAVSEFISVAEGSFCVECAHFESWSTIILRYHQKLSESIPKRTIAKHSGHAIRKRRDYGATVNQTPSSELPGRRGKSRLVEPSQGTLRALSVFERLRWVPYLTLIFRLHPVALEYNCTILYFLYKRMTTQRGYC